jgi:cardiolipin synthase
VDQTPAQAEGRRGERRAAPAEGGRTTAGAEGSRPAAAAAGAEGNRPAAAAAGAEGSRPAAQVLPSGVARATPPPGGEAARAKRTGEDRILSLANVVSAARLALVPVFAWLLAQPHRRHWFAAAVLLSALGLTDGLDGQLARRLHQVTNVGKVLDTVADRALLAVAVIGTLAAGALPLGVAVAALVREGAVATAAVALALAGARRVDVAFLGKAGTFGLMCALPLFLAGGSTVSWHHVATVIAWVAAVPALVLAWASLGVYAPKARVALAGRRSRQLGQRPPAASNRA